MRDGERDGQQVSAPREAGRRCAGESISAPAEAETRQEERQDLPAYAAGTVGAVAAAVALVLLAVAGRYGYHRDELYFLAAGHHLAWGYPDQPPLVPTLARAMSALAPQSLVVLRLPSIFAAVAVIGVTGLTARELRAGRAAQATAAACVGLSAVFLGAFHLLSTAAFAMLAWAVVLWLVMRILRTGDERLWLAVGVTFGLGLLDNDLLAFLAAGLAVGFLIAGPRRILGSPWLWAGAVIALGMWTPYLIWQGQHGWPQLAESTAIAAGESGSSEPRLLFLPYQLILAGPWLAPVWITGLVRLLRSPSVRWLRALGIAWVFITVVFLITGGKPYYLSGFLPLLYAAGAQPVVDWLHGRRRFALAAAAVALSLPSIPVALPVVPVADVGRFHLAALDYDLGEQVGWPTYVEQIRTAYRETAANQAGGVQILTSNYGEAGAIDHYRNDGDLPAVFSGHTGYWYWGPPTATTVLAVGFSRDYITQFFEHVQLVTTLHNGLHLDNDEQGAPVWRCTGLRRPWAAVWPQLEHP